MPKAFRSGAVLSLWLLLQGCSNNTPEEVTGVSYSSEEAISAVNFTSTTTVTIGMSSEEVQREFTSAGISFETFARQTAGSSSRRCGGKLYRAFISFITEIPENQRIPRGRYLVRFFMNSAGNFECASVESFNVPPG